MNAIAKPVTLVSMIASMKNSGFGHKQPTLEISAPRTTNWRVLEAAAHLAAASAAIRSKKNGWALQVRRIWEQDGAARVHVYFELGSKDSAQEALTVLRVVAATLKLDELVSQ